MYRLEAGGIMFSEKCVPIKLSKANAFPHFTDLPVSSSLYLPYNYSSRGRLHYLVLGICMSRVRLALAYRRGQRVRSAEVKKRYQSVL